MGSPRPVRRGLALGDLVDEVVIVGGATNERWITRPGAVDVRPTEFHADGSTTVTSERREYRTTSGASGSATGMQYIADTFASL